MAVSGRQTGDLWLRPLPFLHNALHDEQLLACIYAPAVPPCTLVPPPDTISLPYPRLIPEGGE